jgi:hypothetical protein
MKPQKPPSFQSEVVRLGTPLLRQWAIEVEKGLIEAVNQAVAKFFERSHPGSKVSQIPTGYQRQGAVLDAAWFSLEEGNEMEAKFLGCFEREDKRSPTGRSDFFQVELLTPAKARCGKGEKAHVKLAPIGEIINLNCNSSTLVFKDLLDDLRNGAEYRIFVHCGQKIELSNGNHQWDMTCACQLDKAPDNANLPLSGGQ